jgi:acyl-coenzyme A thioesterase PaaI-like protein
MAVAGEGEAVSYGERPLPQTVAAAGAMRRLTGLLLSLEHDHPTVDTMLEQMATWEKDLASAAAPDPTPRIGQGGETQRVYLDHACDIGAFNPCFPEYTFEELDAETASGTVTFPVVYEGPPGLVHGGFLAVFFDSITQHQSCAARVTGKTRSLSVTFRRPTPILTELRFDIVRTQSDGKITSTARLLRDTEVLCIGEVNTVASSPDKLTGFQFGKRRDESR